MSLTLTDERDFAMRDEINEGVKLKPRVMAGNEQSRRPRPWSVSMLGTCSPFLSLVLHVGPLRDESGGLETGMSLRSEGRRSGIYSRRVQAFLKSASPSARKTK